VKELPKSRVKICFKNRRYWVSRGSFRPSFSVRAATASSVAFSPRIRRAGSPGMKRMMENTRMVTTNRTGII